MKGIGSRHIISLLLIALFALALSPKQVLHDIVSNHKHLNVANHDEDRISKTYHICDTDNTVATSPFSCVDDVLVESFSEKFFITYEKLRLPIRTVSFTYPQLRGPPPACAFT